VPSNTSAHTWLPPAATSIALRFGTITGIERVSRFIDAVFVQINERASGHDGRRVTATHFFSP